MAFEDVAYPVMLVVLAFSLGACPFSLWVGRCFLKRDITLYGDGNPGAANVLRAGGGIRLLALAAALDGSKGVPFVVLAHWTLGLTDAWVLVIGLSAILGHAFSPFLALRGGKAVAVTVGVFFALPRHDPLLAFAAFTLLSLLLIDSHAWTVIFGILGSTAYVVASDGASWYALFMACVAAVMVVRHRRELRVAPRPRVALGGRLRSSSRQ